VEDTVDAAELQICLREVGAGDVELSCILYLQCRVVVVREAIHGQHLVARLEKSLCKL
jgi:hypothetical protein